MGNVTVGMWNLAIVAGSVTLLLGFTQSREYAEYIWPIDILVLLTFALIFYNLFRTVLARQERLLYVSVWYALAALLFTFWIYFFGNAVWNPGTGAIRGIADAVLAWFYGHGIVGLFLTPLAIAARLLRHPYRERRPLFSHTLSLLGFWSILYLLPSYRRPPPAPDADPHLAQGRGRHRFPGHAPARARRASQPLAHHEGAARELHANVGGKWVFAGLVWYLIVCLQGPFQSLPIIQRVTHLTNWVIGHSHIAVLGIFRLHRHRRDLFLHPEDHGQAPYSTKLADIQYWLVLIGASGFFFVLTMAGLIQGNAGSTAKRSTGSARAASLFRFQAYLRHAHRRRAPSSVSTTSY